MVVEEMVEITVNPTSRKHFIDKGYDVPACSFRNKNPPKIIVKTTDLMPSSHKVVKRKCDDCGKIDEVQFRNAFRPCYSCSMKRITKDTEYKYRTTNREYGTYVHQAKKRGYEFKLTHEEFAKIVSQPCHYCGDYFVGVDRKDNDKGYTLDNCLPCCKYCNYAKRELSYEAFIKRIEKMYKHIVPD